MSKGTPSFGKRSSGKTHGVCRRCGQPSFNLRKSKCGSCGYGKSKKMKKNVRKNARNS